MREIGDRYGVQYHVGPLNRQFGSVVKKICRLALPGGSRGAGGDAEPVAEIEERLGPELALVA